MAVRAGTTELSGGYQSIGTRRPKVRLDVLFGVQVVRASRVGELPEQPLMLVLIFVCQSRGRSCQNVGDVRSDRSVLISCFRCVYGSKVVGLLLILVGQLLL